MTGVYVVGLGLACCRGASLASALAGPLEPTEPAYRALPGLDAPVPFHPIADPGPADEAWYSRCWRLIRQVLAEAGAQDRRGALLLASSTVSVGAVERGQADLAQLPDFLSQLVAELDWQGPVYWLNTACTSSQSALLLAKDLLAAGQVDEALVLGLELESRLCLSGFAAMQLLARQAARPLARDRDGLVLGEAVAAVRLSRAPGPWRLVGGSQVVDGGELSGASEEAYMAMVRETLAQSPGALDLLKLQAAGSPANDAVEAAALTQLFDPCPPLLSLKPLLGHTLGAAGVAELALLLGLLQAGRWPDLSLPPAQLDAALGINFSAQPPTQVRRLLSCNLGFGGSHACVLLERI